MSKFAFLFSEGLKNLWRHKLTAIASILTITICLLFIGTFILLGQNTHHLIEYFRGKYKIEVFFDEQLSNTEATGIVNQLSTLIYVRSTTFISKEDATKIFKQQYGEDVEEMVGYNPFPASCVVNLVEDYDTTLPIDDILSEIRGTGGVSEVHHQGRLIRQIEKGYFLALEWGLYGSVLLILLSVVIVSNTIRLTVYAKKELVHIMKTIGASNGFVRAPFVMEAIFQSLIASTVACGSLYAIVKVGNNMLPRVMQLTLQVDVMLIGVVTGLAFIIALLGSIRAVSTFL